MDTDGIRIETNGSNAIEGRFIGTNADGSAAVPNYYSGVAILNAPSNTIGGTTPQERNIISGGQQYGIWLSGSGNAVHRATTLALTLPAAWRLQTDGESTTSAATTPSVGP